MYFWFIYARDFEYYGYRWTLPIFYSISLYIPITFISYVLKNINDLNPMDTYNAYVDDASKEKLLS